jgi:hypothetical protein
MPNCCMLVKYFEKPSTMVQSNAGGIGGSDSMVLLEYMIEDSKSIIYSVKSKI